MIDYEAAAGIAVLLLFFIPMFLAVNTSKKSWEISVILILTTTLSLTFVCLFDFDQLSRWQYGKEKSIKKSIENYESWKESINKEIEKLKKELEE